MGADDRPGARESKCPLDELRALEVTKVSLPQDARSSGALKQGHGRTAQQSMGRRGSGRALRGGGEGLATSWVVLRKPAQYREKNASELYVHTHN